MTGDPMTTLRRYCNRSRRASVRLGTFLMLLVLPQILIAQSGFVHAQGGQLVDGHGQVLMLRGTNLGNWLVREGYMFHFDDGPQSTREIEALTNELLGPDAARKFWRDYMDRYVTRDDIQFIKQAGFNSIRIPFHYKYFLAGDDEGFALLDRVIGWSREAGLYVILDMHCAPGGQTGTNIDDSWGYPSIYGSASPHTIANRQPCLATTCSMNRFRNTRSFRSTTKIWSLSIARSSRACARSIPTTSSSLAGRSGTPTSP